MLLRWEEVRRGDLVSLKDRCFFVVRVRHHDIDGPPPGPTEYWSVRYLDYEDQKFRTVFTFEPEAYLVGRK